MLVNITDTLLNKAIIAVTFGVNPWMGMAFGGLTVFILGASILAFLYAFILSRLRKK